MRKGDVKAGPCPAFSHRAVQRHAKRSVQSSLQPKPLGQSDADCDTPTNRATRPLLLPALRGCPGGKIRCGRGHQAFATHPNSRSASSLPLPPPPLLPPAVGRAAQLLPRHATLRQPEPWW